MLEMLIYPMADDVLWTIVVLAPLPIRVSLLHARVDSVIHLTTNNVLHRLFAFAAAILISMWVSQGLWVAQMIRP